MRKPLHARPWRSCDGLGRGGRPSDPGPHIHIESQIYTVVSFGGLDKFGGLVLCM